MKDLETTANLTYGFANRHILQYNERMITHTRI